MTIQTAESVAQSSSEHWRAALYAGLAAAVVALLMSLFKSVHILSPLLGIVIGAAPIVGYDLARGAFGESWRPVIAGLIGAILFVIGIVLPEVFADDLGFILLGLPIPILTAIIWPIVVGALSPNQSIGKLLLASIVGLVVGMIVAFIAAGQNPNSWPAISTTLYWAVWGGFVGVALSAWSKQTTS